MSWLIRRHACVASNPIVSRALEGKGFEVHGKVGTRQGRFISVTFTNNQPTTMRVCVRWDSWMALKPAASLSHGASQLLIPLQLHRLDMQGPDQTAQTAAGQCPQYLALLHPMAQQHQLAWYALPLQCCPGHRSGNVQTPVCPVVGALNFVLMSISRPKYFTWSPLWQHGTKTQLGGRGGKKANRASQQ